MMFFPNTFLLIISIFFFTFSTLSNPLPVIGGDPFTNVDTCIANCDDEPNPHQCKLDCVYGGHPPNQATLEKRSGSEGRRPDSSAGRCMLDCMQDSSDLTMCKHRCYGTPPPHDEVDDIIKRDTILLQGSERRGRRDPAEHCMARCTESLVDLDTCKRRCYGIHPPQDGVEDSKKRDMIPLQGSERDGRREPARYCMAKCTQSLVDWTTCEHRCYGLPPPAHNDRVDSISKRDTVALISGSERAGRNAGEQCMRECMQTVADSTVCKQACNGIPPPDDGVDSIGRRSVNPLPSVSEEKRQSDPERCMVECMKTPSDAPMCVHRCYGAPPHHNKVSSIGKRDAVVGTSPKSPFNACISSCHDKPNPQRCRSDCITGASSPDDGVLPPLNKRSVISLPSGLQEKRQDGAEYCMFQCMEALGDSEACQHRCYGFASQKNDDINKRDTSALVSGSERNAAGYCMLQCMQTIGDSSICRHRCYGIPAHSDGLTSISKNAVVPYKPDSRIDACMSSCHGKPHIQQCKHHCITGGVPPDDGGSFTMEKRSAISPRSGSEEQACMDDCMRTPSDSQMCEQRCFGSSSAKHSDEWSSIGKRDVEGSPRASVPYLTCLDFCHQHFRGESERECIRRCPSPPTHLVQHQRGTMVQRDPNSNIDGDKIDVTPYQVCLDTCTKAGYTLKECMKQCPWAKRGTAEGFDREDAAAAVSFHRQSGESFAGGHTKRDRNSNIDGGKIDVNPYQECIDLCIESGHSLKQCMAKYCPWAKRSTAEDFDDSAADFSFHRQSTAGGHTKRDLRSNDSDDSKACDAKCSRGPPAIREFCKQDCLTNWTGDRPPPGQDDPLEERSESTGHLDNISGDKDHQVKREIVEDGAGVKHAKRDSEDDCANKCALAPNFEECLQNCLY